EARLASTLNALFPATGETDWQKVAAAVALTRPHLSDLRRPAEARLASTLNALFPATGETDWQKVAAAVALTRP
ncbi:hypothetical protein EVG14_28725, partial [Klebsiella pneumoniae]